MAQNVKIQRYEGQTTNGSKDLLTKASTAITAGRALTIDADGYVVHATTGTYVIGVAMEAKSSSDTTTAPILIDRVSKGDLWRISVDTGTPARSYVGDQVDFASGGGADITASTNDDMFIWNFGLWGSDNAEILVSFLKTAS